MVAGLNPSCVASVRTAGSASPGSRRPSRTAASMSATISLALEPDGRYCVGILILCTVTKFWSDVMVFLQPELTGEFVRLEPLHQRHAAGLVAATADAGDLYRMTTVPFTEGDAVEYIALAEAMRASGTAAPFAVIRRSDDEVIGSSR